VIAVEKTETVSLGRIDVVRALTHSPDLALSLLKSLSVRLRQANTRLGEQAEQSPAP